MQQREQQIYQRLIKAQPEEKYRKNFPFSQDKFPEEDFYQFKYNNKQLKTYRYKAEDEQKALLLMFHGLGSSQPLGVKTVSEFVKIGCEVVGYDYLGHGGSQGETALIEQFDIFMEIAENFFLEMEKLYKDANLPIFVSGISLGGLVSLMLGVKFGQKLSGVIMYAPALKQIDVGFNKMEKTFKVKQDCIVKNPLIMEIMKMNPAGDVEYPNQTYMSFIDGINKAQQNLKNLYAPWILVQGELDKVVHPYGAIQLEQESPSKDKTLLMYPDLWHVVWFEEEYQDFQQKILQWIIQRIIS